MWTVEWADYRFHAVGDKAPKKTTETFHDKESAERRRDELKLQGMIATMRPMVIKQKGLQTALRNQSGDRFNSDWTLHR